MLHLGRDTTSRIISAGIAAGRSNNTYRRAWSRRIGARQRRLQFHQLRLVAADRHGVAAARIRCPISRSKNSSAIFEHEATTSKISEDQLFYCRQRGLSPEEATALIVNGFVRDVLQQLPMEFAVEAQKLIAISLEGSVG